MKIIFLDIYGVLITQRTIFSLEKHNKSILYMWDKTGAGLIKNICKEFDSKIVISSRFRITEKEILLENIERYNLSQYLHKDFYTPICDNNRGNEINSWLKKYPEVTKYVIIDDDVRYINKDQSPFIIKTTIENGILYENYLQIRKIFS